MANFFVSKIAGPETHENGVMKGIQLAIDSMSDVVFKAAGTGEPCQFQFNGLNSSGRVPSVPGEEINPNIN